MLYVSLAREHGGSGRVHAVEMPLRPGRLVPQEPRQEGARALVVNSGNANAFTGRKGAEAVKMTADIAAKAAGCRASQVFIASTGVIGEPLDATKFKGVLDSCEKKAKPLPGSMPPRRS